MLWNPVVRGPFPKIALPPNFGARELMAGNDSGLDVAVAIEHVSENLLQSRERRFASNVVVGTNLLFRNQPERPSNGVRRVMESCFQGNFRIMQAISIKLHLCAAGASAKKVYRTTFAHHLRSPLPGFRTADCLDDNVSASPFSRYRTDCFYRVLNLGDLHYVVRPHVLYRRHLRITLDYRHHIAPNRLGHLHEHQSDRAAADHDNGVADLHSSLVQTPQHAS